MKGYKFTFFWPLRLIAVLSIVAPAIIFSYSTWQNRQAIDAQSDERIERALDVLQEHALKALQTVERSISETNEVLGGLSDEDIRANEADLFVRLKRTQQALPQIESIWVFDSTGRPLVSSTVLPAPRDVDVSGRGFFTAQQNADAATYVGVVDKAIVGSLRFFVVSGRRQGEQAGRFNGVIGVTIMPGHFSEFYRKLTRGSDVFVLVRGDGNVLARYPEFRSGTLAGSSTFAQAVQVNPEAGYFTTHSQLDGIERRVGYRKVPGFPVYVSTGIETSAISAEFWNTVATQLALGLPIVLFMFALTIYALHRAERFREETVRREIAEAALKQAQRLEAIGQLTGGVAHDFNNLLMVVSGNAQRLKRMMAASTDERQRGAVDAIMEAVKRGTDLTRHLLAFSRRQTHEAKVIDLKERLPSIQSMLQSSLRGDIAVRTDVVDDLWRTKLDTSEFELALLNLAVNARDAMNGGGRLNIVARNVTLVAPNELNLAGDFVTVGVQDTGTGIPPDVLDRVFEPFFTTKDAGKGTGLGLSQVYGFAQQAGGTATVNSEVGKGTIVTLYLPRSYETISTGIPAANTDGIAAATPRARERSRVLLVEDNPDVADVTRSFLEEFGYVVMNASDVPTARAMLKAPQEKVDIVLTDIVMPGGADGLDLARWVRQEHGEGLPVILATGYSEKAQTAADEGFAIIRKPYDMPELHATLADAMRKSRKHNDVA